MTFGLKHSGLSVCSELILKKLCHSEVTSLANPYHSEATSLVRSHWPEATRPVGEMKFCYCGGKMTPTSRSSRRPRPHNMAEVSAREMIAPAPGLDMDRGMWHFQSCRRCGVRGNWRTATHTSTSTTFRTTWRGMAENTMRGKQIESVRKLWRNHSYWSKSGIKCAGKLLAPGGNPGSQKVLPR